MQRAEHLLRHGLDRHGPDLLVAEGLQQSVNVRSIGLVPNHVRPDVLRRQQHYNVTEFFDPARPEVGRAARLHHDRRLLQLSEELQELVARQSPASRDTARSIRDADLEDFLCDVDRSQSIVLHDGLLLVPSPRSDFGT